MIIWLFVGRLLYFLENKLKQYRYQDVNLLWEVDAINLMSIQRFNLIDHLNSRVQETIVNKNYIQQRINIFAGKPINPTSDLQVRDVLLELKIKLPQNNNLDDALRASNDEHEIIKLIVQYRKLV